MTPLEQILVVSNNDLEAINMQSARDRYGLDKRFCERAGVEHYRLLSYIASRYDDATLLDIGTFDGCSAVALASNKSNHVISYDVVKHNRLPAAGIPNITFVLGDILQPGMMPDATVILLDTEHEGTFERKLIAKLREINWHGLLLLDDIREWSGIVKLWSEIDGEKYDLTSKGHWSGTGLLVL